MKKIILTLLLLTTFNAGAATPSITGTWQTIDDETHKPSSYIEIYQTGQTFSGKIVKLIDPDEPNPVCHNCPGNKNGKSVLGLEILWGMQETKPNQEWSGGRILDPRKGKTYKCRLRLKDANSLDVRGFIGFSLLGRTQRWTRIN